MSAVLRGMGKKNFPTVGHLEFLSALSRIPFAPFLLHISLVHLAISFQALKGLVQSRIVFKNILHVQRWWRWLDCESKQTRSVGMRNGEMQKFFISSWGRSMQRHKANLLPLNYKNQIETVLARSVRPGQAGRKKTVAGLREEQESLQFEEGAKCVWPE